MVQNPGHNLEYNMFALIRKKAQNIYKETIPKNLLNLMKDHEEQIHIVCRSSNLIIIKKNTSKHTKGKKA